MQNNYVVPPGVTHVTLHDGNVLKADKGTVLADSVYAAELTAAGFSALAVTGMNAGVWTRVPSLFRLRLVGTGTVVLDSMDSLGNITLGVHTATATNATNQIEFVYAGDAAVAVRANTTGSLTVELLEGAGTAAKVAAEKTGRGQVKKRSNILSKCVSGYLQANNTGGNPYTLHVETVLEAPFDLVRIGILNADTVPVVGVKASIAVASALGANNSAATIDPVQYGGTWYDCQFAGATSGTAPAATAGAGVPICGIVWTDWILAPSLARTDGGVLPVIHVRTEVPGTAAKYTVAGAGASFSGYESEGNATTAPYRRPYRVRGQAVAGCTTKSAFTSTATLASASCGIIIQYALRNGFGSTLVVLGDSVYEGIGATIDRCGWAAIFQNAVSTPTNPVSICNLAVAGSGSPTFYTRLNAVASGLADTNAVVLCPGGSVNSLSTPILNAHIMLARRDFAFQRQAAVANRMGFITSTINPRNPAAADYNSSDSLRVAHNDYLRSTDFPVFDFDAALAGEVDGDGQVNFKAGLTTDNTHPSQAGHVAMADAAASAWNSWY